MLSHFTIVDFNTAKNPNRSRIDLSNHSHYLHYQLECGGIEVTYNSARALFTHSRSIRHIQTARSVWFCSPLSCTHTPLDLSWTPIFILYFHGL